MPLAGHPTLQFAAEAERFDHQTQVADFGRQGVAEVGLGDPGELVHAETVDHVEEFEAEEGVADVDVLPLRLPNGFEELHENPEPLLVGKGSVEREGLGHLDEVGEGWSGH